MHTHKKQCFISVNTNHILINLQERYYKKENIKNAFFHEAENLLRPNGIRANVWVVVINEPVFDISSFLTISDETGEPLYIQGKHGVSEIEKDSTGKYTTR